MSQLTEVVPKTYAEKVYKLYKLDSKSLKSITSALNYKYQFKFSQEPLKMVRPQNSKKILITPKNLSILEI